MPEPVRHGNRLHPLHLLYILFLLLYFCDFFICFLLHFIYILLSLCIKTHKSDSVSKCSSKLYLPSPFLSLLWTNHCFQQFFGVFLSSTTDPHTVGLWTNLFYTLMAVTFARQNHPKWSNVLRVPFTLIWWKETSSG